MPGQTALQGLFLLAVGLVFALTARRYPLGTLAHFGPGMFPLIVSLALLAIGAVILGRSRLDAGERMRLPLRGITVVVVALGAFVLLSKRIDMACGIVALVFVAGLARNGFSWRLHGAVAAVLVGVALAFERLLGLRLGVL